MRCSGIALVMLCGMADSGSAQDKPTGLLVPAYFYPGGADAKRWQDLATAAKGGVLVTAIVNPGSGPGKTADPNYTKAIALLQGSGVTTIGYVATGYGKRDAQQIEADVATWRKLYPKIQGFFLDEQSSKKADVAAHKALCVAIRKALPKAVIVSNPGTVCDSDYFGKDGPDVICVFENTGSVANYAPPENFKPAAGTTAALVHTTPKGIKLKDEIATAREKGFGMVYVTDDAMPNPWDTLPSYWLDLVKAVQPAKPAPKPAAKKN